MHRSLVAGPMGILVGLLLVGCGSGNRKGPDQSKSQGPNQVILQVVGMT